MGITDFKDLVKDGRKDQNDKKKDGEPDTKNIQSNPKDEGSGSKRVRKKDK